MTADPASRISPELRTFTGHHPWERQSILDFMIEAARAVAPGARVLDVGAGEAPYRDLFAHADYRTSDWQHSVHPGARGADVIGSADDLPLPDGSFEAVILTQVLEHVAHPEDVLAEARRILTPGGGLFLTLPLVWELHEEPFDYWRYTPYSLRLLLVRAGFVDVDIIARNDCFATVAQLLRNLPEIMGRRADGLDAQREQAGDALRALSTFVASFGGLDARGVLPLGYAVRARSPATAGEERAGAGLSEARAAIVLALADELADDPGLLAAYGRAFSDDDDVTLAVYAPGRDALDERLLGAVDVAGLQGDATPDVLALQRSDDPLQGELVARCAVAFYGRRRPPAALRGLPSFDDAAVETLRARLSADRPEPG